MSSPFRSKSRLSSFGHAFSGWWYVIRTQRNAWIHGLASLIAIAIAVWLALPTVEIAIVLLAIGLVWTAEFVNTAIEASVDLASPGEHPLARVGKDVGAAAVLIAALIALLIGILIFGPPLMARLSA
jgi:diacylglycerol kinase